MAMGNRMVSGPMISRDPERSKSKFRLHHSCGHFNHGWVTETWAFTELFAVFY